MGDKAKAIGTVAAGCVTGCAAGGVVAGVPGIVIGVILTVAGLAISSKTHKDK